MNKNHYSLFQFKHFFPSKKFAFLLCICFNITLILKSTLVKAQGANTPFKTIEAEKGIPKNGASLRALTAMPGNLTPELEASGRAFVELNATGQSVDLTNNTGITANTIVIRASIPDAPTGGGIDATLNLYVDGVFRQALNLTSRYSWVYGDSKTWDNNNPTAGNPHRFYDEARAFITGAPIDSGSIITLKKDVNNTASFYYVDLIDLESVDPPVLQPANSLSVTLYGASANDGTDDTNAFKSCITACQNQGKTMWIPEGVFHTSGIINASGISIAGAGMWYTTLSRIIGGRHKWNLTNCNMKDIYIFSPEVGRTIEQGHDFGMTAQGANGWIVERVWAHNLGPGFWMSGTNGTIRDCRSSNSWADGINLNNSGSVQTDFAGLNLTCENNFVRGSTDDGIALNSQNGGGAAANMVNTKIINNTSIATIWANGIRIAGGRDTKLQNNLIQNAADNNGIKLAIFGTPGNPLESILVSDNLIINGTGWREIGAGNGGIHITEGAIGTIKNNTISGSKVGVLIENCNVTLDSNLVVNSQLQGFKIVSGATGAALITNNTVTGIKAGQLAYQKLANNTFTATLTGNSWQPLPIKLSNYYALKDLNKVRIGWITLTESNNSYFSLSRSGDGENFEELAKVIGSSYSLSVKNYEIQDKSPLTGINYYRLIQYDLNGDSTDYGIKAVKFNLDNNSTMVAYPNPSNGKFTINLKNNSTEKTNIVIQDINGKTFYNQLHTPENGKIQIALDVPIGYYILKAININSEEIQKILIQ